MHVAASPRFSRNPKNKHSDTVATMLSLVCFLVIFSHPIFVLYFALLYSYLPFVSQINHWVTQQALLLSPPSPLRCVPSFNREEASAFSSLDDSPRIAPVLATKAISASHFMHKPQPHSVGLELVKSAFLVVCHRGRWRYENAHTVTHSHQS